MKKYETPTLIVSKLTSSEEILVGSDVIIDAGDLFGTEE